MKLQRAELKDYRNYTEECLCAGSGVNILLGPNAQGKTNLLEAVFYAALGRSHRTNADGELIRWEAEDARMRFVFTRLGVENELEFRIHRGRRREIGKNGHAVRMKDIIGSVCVVLFSPEDLFLVKGAPAGRRRFLDMEISQADASYFYDLAVYTRLLLQRNRLLKRVRDGAAQEEELSVWDVQLVPRAVAVMKKRLASVRRIGELADTAQRELSAGGERLSASYEIFGLEGRDPMTTDLLSWYNDMLRESVKLDILRGSTRFGPHRDDLLLSVNGADLRSYGSQGQQRTGALALKLAELEFFREETGEYPILLLDDVMSELDGSRREKLLSFIRAKDIQTIVTATDEAYFPPDVPAAVYDVKGGRIRRREQGHEGERDAAHAED